ncbi:hypothetical protein [Glaciecola sp. SC05]|uniref:hypothetical protein n=1 Tax=Glaciecola sp. SC05 TaxID=1987355 RepID=UPI003527C966
MHLSQYLLFVVTLVISLISQSLSAQTPVEVLNAYPNCDYQIIETVVYTHNVGLSRNALDQDDVEKEAARIISRMQSKAQDLSADAIILTERNLDVVDLLKYKSINFSAPKYNTLSFTGELIKLCEPSATASKGLTPFDSRGKPQKALSLGTLGGWEQTIELDISGRNQRIVTLVEDHSVSLEQGAFGLQLRMPLAEVHKRLGTPTLSLRAENEYLILAYGRELWLVFNQGVLISISSYQSWLSSEFVNFLAFDDRFDDRAWTAEGVYEQNRALQLTALPQAIVNDQLLFENQHSQLRLYFEDFIMGSESEIAKKVVNFALQISPYSQPSLDVRAIAPELMQVINAFLTKQSTSLDINSLGLVPRASAWLSQSKVLHWYGGSMIIEMIGSSVNNIYMLENPSLNNGKEAAWHINGIRQYQSMEETLGQLGENVFQLGDTIEITESHYVQELIFYELTDEPVLISSKITIY